MKTLELMQRFCQKPRTAGTAFNREIKGQIVKYLERFGYAVTLDEHPFRGWQLIGQPSFKFLRPQKRNVKCIAVMRSGSTNGQIISGTLKNAFAATKTFEAYDFQKFTVVDDKEQDICVVLTRPDMVWAQPIDNDLVVGELANHLPHLIVDRRACAEINTWLAKNKTVRVEFSINTKRPDSYSDKITNILARKPRTRDCFIVSAHYDSFFNTVGAHDNASGTVALLRLAGRLAQRKYADVKPTLCFFDAEEWNKYGSKCFVNDRVKDSSLKTFALQVNIDSVGRPSFLYMLTSPTIEHEIQNIAAKINRNNKVQVKELASRNDLPQFDVCDFMRNGVDVVQVGSRSNPPFKGWHSPEDNLAGIGKGEFLEEVIAYMEDFIVDVWHSSLMKGKRNVYNRSYLQ